MSIRRAAPRLSIALAIFAATACAPEADDFEQSPPGTGGTGGTGTAGAGGAQAGTTASGGSVTTGGTTGGSVSSGGATGGSVSSGGSAGSGAAGGAAAGTGGSTGGASAGTGVGGASAGTGGTSGGGAGTAGSGTGGATPTMGCNAATFPESGEQTLTVDGTAREYIVAVPEGYVSSTPHRLVFAFHGLTGTMEQIANGYGGRNNGYYGLQSRMTDTIFVAPQGLAPEDEPDQFGWPNEGGRDVAFVAAMIAWLGSSYCIDTARVFSTGFSYGGIMSNTLGCQMPDSFRAIAPMAGALFGRGSGCTGKQVAAWMTHGLADETVTPMSGETARDAFIAKNHCTTTTVATTPEGCLAYQGCDAGYPVVWCTHSGAHTIPSYAGEAIAAFFGQF